MRRWPQKTRKDRTEKWNVWITDNGESWFFSAGATSRATQLFKPRATFDRSGLTGNRRISVVPARLPSLTRRASGPALLRYGLVFAAIYGGHGSQQRDVDVEADEAHGAVGVDEVDSAGMDAAEAAFAQLVGVKPGVPAQPCHWAAASASGCRISRGARGFRGKLMTGCMRRRHRPRTCHDG